MSAPTKKGQPRTADKRPLPDDFVSVARRLGADESKERFEEKLKKIAKVRPSKGAKDA
jgi:hypothetical protein